MTSITFIFLIGVFMSSWLGASLLGLGEFCIKRMPLVRHIYSASKQISAAISPGTKPLRPKILACQVDLVLRESTLASRVVDALTARNLAICTGHRALFVPVEATGTSWPVLNAGYFSTGTKSITQRRKNTCNCEDSNSQRQASHVTSFAIPPIHLM